METKYIKNISKIGDSIKILFVIKSLKNKGGGAEKVLSSISNNLLKKNHDIHIITFDKKLGETFYYFNSKIKVKFLEIGNVEKSTSFLVFLKSIFILRKEILSLNPKIVIGFMHSSFIPLGIIKFFTKYNLIASEHASYDFYKNRPIEKFLYKIVSSKFDHITTVSSQCKNLFPKKISKRMIVIQNPIENQDYAHNQIKQNKTILSVGSLKDYKNHSLLINVFCKLKKNFPNWNLKIIGDGEEYQNLSDQINGIKSISLIKSQKNLKEYYLHASIFVIPSEFESFSLVTAEALHYQLPVFGFNNCIGLQDLIVDGENGCLVDSNGDKSLNLYNKLNYYLSNDKYKNLSKNNKKIISDYEINNVVNKWNDLIEK